MAISPSCSSFNSLSPWLEIPSWPVNVLVNIRESLDEGRDLKCKVRGRPTFSVYRPRLDNDEAKQAADRSHCVWGKNNHVSANTEERLNDIYKETDNKGYKLYGTAEGPSRSAALSCLIIKGMHLFALNDLACHRWPFKVAISVST